MSYNHHLRKRVGDQINNCLCHQCFAQKCCAYEITIATIQSEYAYFKAYVEHKRGNKEISRALQEEDHFGILSDYARNPMREGNHARNEDNDYNIIDELLLYLKSNDFKFKWLDTYELQNMMR